MTFQWKPFLDRHRYAVMNDWVVKLKNQVSEQYSRRSEEELRQTVGDAYDSFSQVLGHNDYSKIKHFISEITRIRLEAGFPLEDVQKAFELFRGLILPILIHECPARELGACIDAVNRCLAYTIHRFSNRFQRMFNQHLEDYAFQLELDVKKRTRELEESETMYRGLVEGISDGYLVTQRDVVTFVNTAFCRMHHADAGEILTRSFQTLVAPESWHNVLAILETPQEPSQGQAMLEYKRLTRDGQVLPTEITITSAPYKGRHYNLCVCRDITQRTLMEKKIRETERMAYVGQITASLSHELRNPLSSIKMNLQILMKPERDGNNDQRRLEISVNAVRRLERILKELLDYAKPQIVDIRPVRLNAIVSSSIDLVDIRLREKRITCRTDLDSSADAIDADAGKLEQVMINLMLNAVDSIGAHGTITISTRRQRGQDGDYAEIRVEDNGTGALPENLATLFEPYYTTKSTGIGLGLVNAKRIIEAHGGTIQAGRRKPSGACFTIILPAGETHGQTTGD